MREGGCGRQGKGKRGDGGGEDGWGKVVGWCGLAIAQDVKRSANKKVAAACFPHKRYC